MPKGILLKLKRPKGVMKVVRRRESSATGICQNPLLASNLLKTLAPVSCAKVSSTLGKGCTSLRTAVFNGFRSMQMRTEPSFFGSTTMPAHHGVGTSTFEITPIDSIRSSSFFTVWRSGRGTFLGV